MSEDKKDLQQKPMDNPYVEGYHNMPPAMQSYFRFKKALKGPELTRDEQGLTPKRFSKNYYEDTCPFCESTAEHEAKKYRYSKTTSRKILINLVLMLLVAIVTGVGILNLYIGLGVIALIGYSTSVHAERKMYYTMLCRKCGAQFPMDKEEQDKIRMEQKIKREDEAQ